MLSFTAITKRYGAVVAVDGVSLNVEKGESFALLGPNGAGKSTLVKMLMGFVRPTLGSVTVNGRDCADPLSRSSIGYLSEDHRIPPYLTGRQYLARQAALLGMDKKKTGDAIAALVQTVGMAGKEGMRASTYSKGMNQRIGLAAAMMGAPSLLILDEPVSGLDPIGIREFRMILDSMRNAGATVLLNSHLLSEVEKTCSTAAIINRGKILVKDRIQNIVRDGETLEDVFVRLVKGDAHA